MPVAAPSTIIVAGGPEHPVPGSPSVLKCTADGNIVVNVDPLKHLVNAQTIDLLLSVVESSRQQVASRLGKRKAPLLPDGEYAARSVCVLRVPAGASSRDSVALYDTKRRVITPTRVRIPDNAFEGAFTAYEQPHARFKLVLLDGEGYKVGGTATQQHAARLYVHRGLCGGGCGVLGCGAKLDLFEASANVLAGYEEHWRKARKAALRAHEHGLKVKSATWSCRPCSTGSAVSSN